MNRTSLTTALLVPLVCGFTATALAEDCTQQLEAMRAWAQDAEPEPFVATVRVWRAASMSEQDALAGLAKIEGLVDHPDRDRLEQGLFEARNGGWTDEYRFWHVSDDQQRVAFGRMGGTTTTDMALDGTTAWSLGQTGLMIIDSRNPPPQTNLAQAIGDMFRTRVDYLRVAGLNPHLQNARITECRTNPDGSWSGRLAWNDGASEIEIAGSVGAAGALRIEEVRVSKNDRPTSGPQTWTRLSNFQTTPAWDRPIAWTAERIDETGDVVSRTELVAIEPFDPKQAAAMLAIPKDGASDPIRGQITLVGISDLRPGGEVLFKDGDTFKKVEGFQDAVPASRNRGLWAGALAGLAVLGCLVWFMFSRKK